MKTIRSFLVLPLFLLATGAQGADEGNPRIIDLCLDLKRPLPMCRCSAARLEQQAASKDFNDYAAVGESYLQNKRRGMRRRTAWSNALADWSKKSGEPADSLGDRLDAIAGKHRMTMQQCSQQ